MLYFTVTGQSISCIQDAAVGDSVDYIECRFDFDASWNGLTKTAQFTQNGKTYNAVLEKDVCRMPNEMCAGEILVSVFGVLAGETLRITTEAAAVRMLCSGFVSSGTTPVPPTPDLYAQLVKKVNDAAESVPQLFEKEMSEHKLLSQDDVSDLPSSDSSNPISGKALNAAISNLSPVASSGQYDDLRDKPAIPTKTSDLTDDVGYLKTSGETASIQYSNYGVSIAGSGGVSLGTSSGTIELKADGTGTVELSSTEGEVIIHNLTAPQNDSDAATKGYVDEKISSAVATALNTAV